MFVYNDVAASRQMVRVGRQRLYFVYSKCMCIYKDTLRIRCAIQECTHYALLMIKIMDATIFYYLY